jgi:hypothetical protein
MRAQGKTSKLYQTIFRLCPTLLYKYKREKAAVSVVTKSISTKWADKEAIVQKKNILNFVLIIKETDHVLELCFRRKTCHNRNGVWIWKLDRRIRDFTFLQRCLWRFSISYYKHYTHILGILVISYLCIKTPHNHRLLVINSKVDQDNLRRPVMQAG